MGTVVGLPSGSDLVSPCNQCLRCLVRSMQEITACKENTLPLSDSVYKLASKPQPVETTAHYLGPQIYITGPHGAIAPTAVRIAGCNASPCVIRQGTTAHMQIDFRANARYTALRPHVFAHFQGTRVEYPLQAQFHNACNHLTGNSCPVNAGETITYNFAFAVTQIYPPIQVQVQLSLWNQLNREVFCTMIPVRVARA